LRLFYAECTACQWESTPADLQELAADMGLDHLAHAHAPLIETGDTSIIRLWEYHGITGEQVDAYTHWEPEPTPAPPKPAAMRPAPPPTQPIKRVKPGKERR